MIKDSNTWEKYATMDDIDYTMTEWFPKKIKPVHVGQYMIKSAGKNSWEHRALWTGTRWINSWYFLELLCPGCIIVMSDTPVDLQAEADADNILLNEDIFEPQVSRTCPKSNKADNHLL